MPIDSLKKILTARVYDVAVETPLELAPLLSTRFGNRIYCKREDMQSVFSFKLRRACNKMAQLKPEQRDCGVVCASAGNHAQGVALAAAARVSKWCCTAIRIPMRTSAPAFSKRSSGSPLSIPSMIPTSSQGRAR